MAKHLTYRREPVIEKCIGCARVFPTIDVSAVYGCTTYSFPASQWRRGNCPLATHIAKKAVKEKFINPLKKSKKSFQKSFIKKER